MPGASARVRCPSEVLREAGLGGGVGGKAYGAGESEAAVGVALGLAIEMFARSKRAGRLNVALLLRRVLVSDMAVGRAAQLAGIGRTHAHYVVKEFREEIAEICRRNEWNIEDVLK